MYLTSRHFLNNFFLCLLLNWCYLQFEDPLDAEDAIRGRDGYNFDGCRIRVIDF